MLVNRSTILSVRLGNYVIAMQHKYLPIDCGFHDILLDRTTRNSVIELEYLVEEVVQLKRTTLKDVYSKEGEEFLLLKDGEIVRLDRIKSVDGIPLQASKC